MVFNRKDELDVAHVANRLSYMYQKAVDSKHEKLKEIPIDTACNGLHALDGHINNHKHVALQEQ